MIRLPGVRPRGLVAALEPAGFVRHPRRGVISTSGSETKFLDLLRRGSTLSTMMHHHRLRPSTAQEELRRRALFLVGRQGLTQAQAAAPVGARRQTVNIWLQRFRAQGEDGALDGRRGSPRRGKGLLTADEAGRLRRWLADKTPDQLKLPRGLRAR